MIVGHQRRTDLSRVKQLLSSVYWAQKRLAADVEHLALLRARAECVGGADYSMGITSGGVPKTIADAAVELVAYECRVADLVRQRTCALQAVTAIIDQIAEERLRVLLFRRYRDFHTWGQICEDMQYSWRHVHRLHVKALLEAKKVLDHEKMAHNGTLKSAKM